MKELIEIKTTLKESIFPNSLRLQIGQAENGTWILNYYKNEKHILSKKCSSEADARQRFGKYEMKYFHGANINL